MRQHRRIGALTAVAIAGVVAVACGAQPAPALPVDGALHPLAQRQATAQAQQAPAVQAAQEAAATAVAARAALAAEAVERARAEAVGLLGAAVAHRQAGDLAAAIQLARQAQEKWAEYAEAAAFIAEVSPQATAQARAAAPTPAPPAPTGANPPGRAVRPTATPVPVPTIAPPPVAPVPAEQELIARATRVITGTGVAALQELAGSISQHGVTVYFAALPRGVGAVWQPPRNAIAISDQYRSAGAEGIAGILVHEGTHVYDHYRGRNGGTTADCYDLEGRAFASQARLWEALYGRGGKTGALDSLDQQMNRILFVVNEKPLTFAVELLSLYQHQCA